VNRGAKTICRRPIPTATANQVSKPVTDRVQQFRSILLKSGVNAFVEVPARVSKSFGQRGNVPVNVFIGSGRLRSTLVPIGGGRHRLYINESMLRFTTATVGHRVSIGLKRDAASRMPPMPTPLRTKLRLHSLALRTWRDLVPSKQKEILRYLGFAKKSETLGRNIEKLLVILESREGQGLLNGIAIRRKSARPANL
jgi:hypothetical protein